MQKYGFQYEAVVETCVDELERDSNELIAVLSLWHLFPEGSMFDDMVKYAEGPYGRRYTEQFIEKIRNFHNWDEWSDAMTAMVKT